HFECDGPTKKPFDVRPFAVELVTVRTGKGLERANAHGGRSRRAVEAPHPDDPAVAHDGGLDDASDVHAVLHPRVEHRRPVTVDRINQVRTALRSTRSAART